MFPINFQHLPIALIRINPYAMNKLAKASHSLQECHFYVLDIASDMRNSPAMRNVITLRNMRNYRP